MNAMLKTGALAALTVTLLGGCASYTGQTNDPNDPNRTRSGALIGAGIGAVAGLLSGGDAFHHGRERGLDRGRRRTSDRRGGRRRGRLPALPGPRRHVRDDGRYGRRG